MKQDVWITVDDETGERIGRSIAVSPHVTNKHHLVRVSLSDRESVEFGGSVYLRPTIARYVARALLAASEGLCDAWRSGSREEGGPFYCNQPARHFGEHVYEAAGKVTREALALAGTINTGSTEEGAAIRAHLITMGWRAP